MLLMMMWMMMMMTLISEAIESATVLNRVSLHVTDLITVTRRYTLLMIVCFFY